MEYTEYTPTIGLEVHAELKTRTKMFCDSKNDPDETRPNVNICPICMAHPGTLPVINKEAVRHILRIGVAAKGTIADFTEFDRKNYFYPDIPKGYQISQYQYPLVRGGTINGVVLTRIHLEEDTARSTHDEHEMSLIDFNRAGVPLMELVTEPVVRSAAEAVAFAKELQLLLRTLGASEANMEKGEMRVEANVSVSREMRGERRELGTKVEIKNLNSFRSVERAIDFEVKRQIAVLEAGENVIQETRGWNEARQQTFSQRIKEESHDYRYFPDPDLPNLYLSRIREFDAEALRNSLPELPWEKRARYRQRGLKAEDADLFVSDPLLGSMFDEAGDALKGEDSAIRLAANYIANDVAALRTSKGKGSISRITGAEIAELVKLLQERKIHSRNAKDIISHMYREGGIVKEISESRGILQDTSLDLGKIVAHIIVSHSDAVAEYQGGKENALQYLVGQGMKATKGTVDPLELRKAIQKALKK